MITRIGLLPHAFASRERAAAKLFERPQQSQGDARAVSPDAMPKAQLAARLQTLAARAAKSVQEAEGARARTAEIGELLRSLRGELGRSEATARGTARTPPQPARSRNVEATETRPIYATIYTYETRVTGTRDLVGDDDDLEGWDDTGIRQGARFTVQVGDGPSAMVEFDQNERIELTISGVTQQFRFEDDEGQWRDGLLAALNAIDGLEARFNAGGALELRTTNGEALTLANGRYSPLDELGFSPGTVEPVIAGSEQVQVGTETVRRTGTAPGQAAAGQAAAGRGVSDAKARGAADPAAVTDDVQALVERLAAAMASDDLAPDLRAVLRGLPDDPAELARPDNIASSLRALDRTIARLDALERRQAAHVADLSAAHELGREVGALLARQLEAPSPAEALALARKTADALARRDAPLGFGEALRRED